MTAELERIREGVASYILSTVDLDRKDRICPSHFSVFHTNPMNVSFGACGVALFLCKVLGEVPDDIRGWLAEQPLDIEEYPPGLYLGLAGVAWAFSEIGMEDRAEEVMLTAYESPLLFAEPSMYIGAAGWGLASLHFHQRTNRQVYLDRAVEAGEHLLRTAESVGDTLRWRHAMSDLIHFGFGYGASGISLFLLYLAQRTGREDFLDAATRGIEFELDNRVETQIGWSWRKLDSEAARILLPYWRHGSAGVGAAVVRFARHLDEDRYWRAAERIAESVAIKWSVALGQFEGISGIGEFMLDMHQATGNQRYRELALDMAETIQWYTIDRPEGIAFPGRWLNRISNDYATGSAGIGLFLNRLLHPGSRWLLDLEPEPVREKIRLPVESGAALAV